MLHEIAEQTFETGDGHYICGNAFYEITYDSGFPSAELNYVQIGSGRLGRYKLAEFVGEAEVERHEIEVAELTYDDNGSDYHCDLMREAV